MKKILLLLTMLMFTLPVTAQENQTQKAEDVKGAVVIKKQPTQESASQKQECNKIYGSIIIMVQGKTPFDKSETPNK